VPPQAYGGAARHVRPRPHVAVLVSQCDVLSSAGGRSHVCAQHRFAAGLGFVFLCVGQGLMYLSGSLSPPPSLNPSQAAPPTPSPPPPSLSTPPLSSQQQHARIQPFFGADTTRSRFRDFYLHRLGLPSPAASSPPPLPPIILLYSKTHGHSGAVWPQLCSLAPAIAVRYQF
jgi:hypothetical protein